VERERGASRRSSGFQVLVATMVCLLFIVAYIAAMHVLVDISLVDSEAERNRRDAVYAYLHLGFLVLAWVVGIVVGKWLNGLGLAYGLLFFIVLVVAMLGVQGASYELACRGHNDLVRHWQC
jgi:hypothetical protein